MHEIIFRGKCIDNGEWVYGDLLQDNSLKRCYISGVEYCTNKNKTQKLLRFDFVYEVISETVGQYTGLTDKNGTKIFEGDICKVADLLYKVIFSYGQWYFDIISTEYICCPYFYSHCGEHCEIIGNIFDNPELIKEN